MKNELIEERIVILNEDILSSEKFHDPENGASWGDEIGILMSRGEVREIVECLGELLSRRVIEDSFIDTSGDKCEVACKP